MPDLFFSSECIIQRNAYLQERKYKYHFDRLYLLYVVLCKIDKNIQNTQLHTNKIFAKSLIKINYHRKKLNLRCISSVQFSSVAQSCPTLCDPMNRSTPGLLVHYLLPEFTQTHVHRVSHAIQPSHPLSSPSPPVPNPSQHQSLFQ